MHRAIRRVQWGETDAGGIVFYPNYFRWFDQGTHDLFRELGCPISGILERGFIVPIVEAHGRFMAALAYEDELSITSTCAEVRTRAFRIEHRVSRRQERVCEGYEVRIWARSIGTELEALPVPDDVRTLLAPAET